MKINTAKHFVLQLGSLISLYLSLGFLVSLIFSLVNLKFPDATEGYWILESASSSARIAIAFLVVFFPTYLVLTRVVNKMRRTEGDGEYLGLTRWLIYLSLLVGSLILLGDLVTVITTFLNGEITQRFILKAFSVLITVGLALHYYILDARGYWLKHESRSYMFAMGVTLLMFIAVAFGVGNIETPTQVREMKLDEKQVMDLQNIQSYIISSYTESSSTLPTSINSAFGEFDAPTAPEGRDAYTYTVTGGGFDLCANFSRDSIMNSDMMSKPFTTPDMPVKNPDNWNYKAGNYCFSRILNK